MITGSFTSVTNYNKICKPVLQLVDVFVAHLVKQHGETLVVFTELALRVANLFVKFSKNLCVVINIFADFDTNTIGVENDNDKILQRLFNVKNVKNLVSNDVENTAKTLAKIYNDVDSVVNAFTEEEKVDHKCFCSVVKSFVDDCWIDGLENIVVFGVLGGKVHVHSVLCEESLHNVVYDIVKQEKEKATCVKSERFYTIE